MQKIMPCLWFNDKAEESAGFYVSSNTDPLATERVIQAMLKMKKLDIRALDNAYNE